MSDTQQCANCGAPQPASSPEGLCPRCLMQQALAGSVADASTNALPPCGLERTVAREPGSCSALSGIAESIGGIPHVLLRDTEIETSPGPVLKPSSTEMPAPAQRPDRYQLFGEIARGGMGAVLRGRDVDLGRDLAVKVLLESHKNEPELIKRFIEEAQIGGQLQHPGVVPVYELGSFADRRPFFTMKLVKGQTLAELLRARSSPHDDLSRFFSIFASMAQTLAYAHLRGVIHRDLKPSNVMVGSFGEVQVMDWGLAKVLPQGGVASEQSEAPPDPAALVSMIRTARTGSDADASQAGSVLGTPSYMAPEQARGELDRVDERADVFGLGAILCEILTGEAAFTGKSLNAILIQATIGDMDRTFARLESCGAEAELIALAKDCLAAERELRPRQAGIVAERIIAYLAGVQERLRQSELARVEERARRRLTMAVAAAVLALVVLGGSGWGYLERLRAARAAGIERGVAAALNEANLLRGQARSQPAGEMGRWSEALSAAKRAEGLLAGGEASSEVQDTVRTMLAGLERERAEAQAQADRLMRDRALLDRLEAAYGSLTEHFDMKRAEAEFTAAFRDFGADLDRLEPKEAGQRLAGRPATSELAWYLHGLATIRTGLGGPEADWRRVLAVAHAADPDSWRDSLRALTGKRDAATAATLGKLADDEKSLQTQPGTSLLMLATQLRPFDRARAEAVMRRAWQLRPGDFFINFGLGDFLQDERVPSVELVARRTDALRFLTAAVAIRPESGMAHFKLGWALHCEGKLDEAISEYRTAIRLKPDIEWAHNNLGAILSDQGKMAEALPELREAERLMPNSSGVHGNLGLTLGRQGKKEESIAEYRKAAQLAPGLAGTHNNLAGALLGAGKRDEAMAEYREAIRIKPDDVEAHDALAGALVDQGKHAEAIAEYRAVIRLKPDLEHVHNNLGAAFNRLGRHEEAIAQFREAIRLNPKSAGFRGNLGDTLLVQGKAAEAIEVYREIARFQPDDAWPRLKIGGALLSQGKRDEAMAEFREAIRLKPDDAGAHDALAGAFLGQGKHAEAIGEYREVIRLNPNLDWVHNNVGLALDALGRREEAIAAFRKAIQLNPDQTIFWPNLVHALREQGKLTEAADACRAALRLNTANASARTSLGGVLLAQGKHDEASAQFREAIRLKPDDAGVRSMIAWNTAVIPGLTRGLYTEAAEHARKAVALAPQVGFVHTPLALAEYRCGRWDQTIAAAERSLALGGENPWDWFFLAMAFAQKGAKDKAAPWFDKAVAQTMEKDPQNRQLCQFWAEAAKLLDRPGPDAGSAAPKDQKPQ